MIDLGWANAGGKVEAEIQRVRKVCIEVLKHKPTDFDHSGGRGTHHEHTCKECGYVYHEDTGD